jgi:activating signal cointegrator complex subunit 3
VRANRQFGQLKYELIDKLESKKFTLPQMRELTSEDLGHLVRHVQAGPILKKYVSYIPHLNIKSLVQPITRTILRVELRITPCFQWNDTWHSPGEPWWILVEDPSTDHLYHTEYVVIHKKNRHDTQQLVFTVPLFEPLSSQYYVRAVSEKWLGALVVEELKLDRLRLPLQYQAHTPLLNLCPLPISALQNIRYQAMYKFQFFNPLQTQFFHTVYHTDENILIGAPTGSGKTVAAELALFRLFNNCPGCKAVYIAPLKALVKERVINWSQRLVRCTDKVIVELTGDVSPDLVAIERADLIVTTPEKWDGVSRSWQSRSYVKKVALIIIDEVLLSHVRNFFREMINICYA